MFKQYIVTDDLQLVNAQETGIWKVFNDLLQVGLQPIANSDEDYIDLKELCKRLSTARQTIYNKISSGILIEGVHFFKPTNGKLIFKWSAMLEWFESKGGKIPERRNPTEHEPTNELPLQSSVKTKGDPPINKDYINI